MREILFPKPFVFKKIDDPVKFEEFLERGIKTSTAFSKWPAIADGMRLLEKIGEAKKSGKLVLENADWLLLKKVVVTEANYVPEFGLELGVHGFFQAVEDAAQVEAKKEK